MHNLCEVGKRFDWTTTLSRGPSRRIADSDAGFTLIELLIAVVIMGLAIVAVLGGLLTLVSASGLHRQQADVSGVVQSTAELIKSDPYVKCATSSTYSLSGLTYPSDVPPANVTYTVSYWNGSSFPSGGSCGTDLGLQQIVIQATSRDKSTQSITIVKGNP